MGKRVLKNVIQTVISAAFLFGVWAIAYVCAGNELLVPSLFDCFVRLGKLLINGGFWQSFFATLARTLIAFSLSFILAAVFAVIAYLYPTFRRFFAPIISIFRSMPTLAVLLIILVWFGGANAPVLVAILALFPMLYAGFSAALSQVDGELLEMSRVYAVPLKKRIMQLYLPSAAPYALREMGAALSFALKLVISAEVPAGTYQSLGGLMQDAKNYLEMPTLFALVIVSFVVGLLLEGLAAWLSAAVERRVK